MLDKNLEALVRSYLGETLSMEELAFLLEEIRQGRGLAELSAAIDVGLSSGDHPQEDNAELADQLFDKVMEAVRRRRARVWRLWSPATAAAVGLLIFGGYYLYQNVGRTRVIRAQTAVAQRDVPPGHNGAILTLSGGAQYVLDSTEDGRVAKQGQVSILKKNDRLVYDGVGSTNEVLYNTLTTPRGRQYRLTLADGTRVWLNAASSLRYPTAFSGSQRRVEVTGEAYFEVARDSKHPFVIGTGRSAEVQVLGTHFNINAYPDEDEWRTTLLEGSVRVTLAGTDEKALELAPGQQGVLQGERDIILIQHADVDAAVAWKNNRFIFDGNDIQEVMRQLARWYDVEVVYRGQPTGEQFIGTIGRFENISSILRMLERTHTVSFSVVGRTVTVMPYTKK